MTEHWGASVNASVRGFFNSFKVKDGLSENFEITRHYIAARYMTACIIIVSACLFSALIFFEMERRSRALDGNLNLLISLSDIALDSQTALYGYNATHLLNETSYRDAALARLSELEQASGQLLKNASLFPQYGDQSTLGESLSEAIANLVVKGRGLLAEGSLSRGPASKARLVGLRDASDFQKALRGTIAQAIEQKERYSNIKTSALLSAALVILLSAFASMFLIFKPMANRIVTAHNALADRKAELERLSEEANAGNEAKSKFLAKMSHELRTPMNGILSMSEILSGTTLAQRQRDYVSLIKQTSGRLLNTLENVLNFSDISAGRFEPKVQAVNFDELIRHIRAKGAELCEGRNIEFTVEMTDDMPGAVFGEVDSILRILDELIENAFKFTDEGSVCVRLWQKSSISENSTHATLVFCVKDTGIGIPADQKENIFREFSQVESSFSRSYEGTGLGLAIAAAISRFINARLSVSSMLGEGATFTLETKVGVVKKALQDTVKDGFAGNFSPKNVIVVTASEPMQHEVSNKLRAPSFEVSYCDDLGRLLRLIAVARQEDVKIDAIVFDHEFVVERQPGFHAADVENCVKPETRIIGLGVWRGWSDIGVMQVAKIETLDIDLSGIMQKQVYPAYQLEAAA